MYQALSNEPHKQCYFSSDQGGKTRVMPKHNAFMSRHSVVGEDFSNAEQEEKKKFYGDQDLVFGALLSAKVVFCFPVKFLWLSNILLSEDRANE